MDMEQGDFSQFMFETGTVGVPVYLLEKMQQLNLSPECLGYLVLALNKHRTGQSGEALAKDPWIRWALGEGWAIWAGGTARRISFSPLWNRLYQVWILEREERPAMEAGEFDYGKILKELDRMRGSLTVTLREKQFIQELNLKYGWTTEFILTFFHLCFSRGMSQLKDYRTIAGKIYQGGLYTVDQLASFMNEIDWTQKKVEEVKRYLGQFGAVTIPQRDLYVKWNQYWGMSHMLILRAAEESVRANNVSFKYLDRVLEDWHQKGVADLTDAEKAVQTHDDQLKDAQRADRPKAQPAARRITHSGNRRWEDD
jgi:DnaD/phage-associated family protein